MNKWSFENAGHAATLTVGDKIKGRVVYDTHGTHWHCYDDQFHQIGGGVCQSIKHGMELLDAR